MSKPIDQAKADPKIDIRTEAVAGLYLLAGRYREMRPMMYALAAISIGLVRLEHVKIH